MYNIGMGTALLPLGNHYMHFANPDLQRTHSSKRLNCHLWTDKTPTSIAHLTLLLRTIAYGDSSNESRKTTALGDHLTQAVELSLVNNTLG